MEEFLCHEMVLGEVWAVLGSSWMPWGLSRVSLEHVGSVLRGSWDRLGAILGPSWGLLEVILEYLGSILEALGGVLATS